MSEANIKQEAPRHAELSPLTAPPARLREPTADDLEFDVSDPTHDLPLDDSERLREDAAPTLD